MKIIRFYGVNCLSIFLVLLLQAEGLDWKVLLGFTSPKNDIRSESDIKNLTCTETKDCTASTNGSICANGLCDCPTDMPIFVNETNKLNMSYCLPALNFTGNCSFSVQCNYENSECVEGICKCAEKFEPHKGRCKIAEKTAMIPIVVGSIIGAAILFTLIVYFIMSRQKVKT